jgi:hypothetical protein
LFTEITNLSLNSETTATANQVDAVNNNFASNAIDGNLGTLWRATSHGTPTDPKYLIVELCDISEISHIVLWGHYTGYVNYYIEYNLYISADGINFTFLSTGKLITPPSSTPPDEYYDSFMDTVYLPAELRLMRFAKFEVIGGQHDAHLNEIEIWGEQTPCSEPCPEDTLAPSGSVHAYGVRVLAFLFAIRNPKSQIQNRKTRASHHVTRNPQLVTLSPNGDFFDYHIFHRPVSRTGFGRPDFLYHVQTLSHLAKN